MGVNLNHLCGFPDPSQKGLPVIFGEPPSGVVQNFTISDHPGWKMTEIRETITINRPVHEVFEFTLNPENTPKWVDGVAQERANEHPAKLGTIYQSQGQDGSWIELEITGYEPNERFVMSRKDSDLHVQYTFKSTDSDGCELEYYVWADSGKLSGPFTEQTVRRILKKLKEIIEAGR